MNEYVYIYLFMKCKCIILLSDKRRTFKGNVKKLQILDCLDLEQKMIE